MKGLIFRLKFQHSGGGRISLHSSSGSDSQYIRYQNFQNLSLKFLLFLPLKEIALFSSNSFEPLDETKIKFLYPNQYFFLYSGVIFFYSEHNESNPHSKIEDIVSVEIMSYVLFMLLPCIIL